ncbi:hypothetical protein [Brevundimonas denitrificans]|uniref:hypothetical protein n=1 Tax=Brevundimonas denitrificans TaxID=1443434 RepID=UPI00223C2110|nr:hypothetical protein [Brevundimonas denitrificans]
MGRLARRLLTLARSELALLTALFVGAVGVLTFIEIADDMTETDGRAFDGMVLNALRPHDDPGHAWGPWWLEEAMADVTSLGGISVLGLFALAVVGFLVIQRKRLSALMLVVGLAGGRGLERRVQGDIRARTAPAEYQAVDTLNASFPSGHALLSTVFYLTVG